MNEKLTRQQITGLLSLVTIGYDALIEHRDHSWTVKAGYWPNRAAKGNALQAQIVTRLTRYTKITVLDTRLVTRTRCPRVEIHFAVENKEK
jgi:hypothetical protein